MQGKRRVEEDVAVIIHSSLSDARHCQVLEIQEDETQLLPSGGSEAAIL